MQYQSSCAPKLARKCGIEHWFPCGADGRAAGGRAVYGHVITKFSGMGRFTYPWCSAGVLRVPELRANQERTSLLPLKRLQIYNHFFLTFLINFQCKWMLWSIDN